MFSKWPQSQVFKVSGFSQGRKIPGVTWPLHYFGSSVIFFLSCSLAFVGFVTHIFAQVHETHGTLATVGTQRQDEGNFCEAPLVVFGAPGC